MIRKVTSFGGNSTILRPSLSLMFFSRRRRTLSKMIWTASIALGSRARKGRVMNLNTNVLVKGSGWHKENHWRTEERKIGPGFEPQEFAVKKKKHEKGFKTVKNCENTYRSEKRSSRRLTMGVPVTAQRRLAFKAYTAFAVLLCRDLQWWAMRIWCCQEGQLIFLK